MSELLWPMYHDLRARVEAIEASIKRMQPATSEPEVPADYNEPTQTDTQEDNPPPEAA